MKPTLIYRHRRENLAKCSLTPLMGRPDFCFFTYPLDPLPNLAGYIALQVGAPPLTAADAGFGLFLIDATWRLASVMQKSCPLIETRSLPASFCTAYPRRQTDCPDPSTGLASIEAIYLAYLILGRPVEGLLENYYWKEQFLRCNNLL